jgi:hypothetical protein
MLTAGRSVALAAALPLVQSCSAVGRETSGLLPRTMPTDHLLSQDEYEILRYASLAPSGHNTQPWTVEIVRPGTWLLGTNPQRRLPAVDPDNREGILSMGPFLENLVIAAGCLGYEADIRYLTPSLRDNPVTEVTLCKGASTAYPIQRLSLRRTVRKNHLATPIRPDDVNLLTGMGDTRFHFFPSGSAGGTLLAEETVEANVRQASRDAAQKELAEWIRWSNSDAEKYRDGLTPASMEFAGIAALFVRMFYDRESVMSEGFREKGVELVKEQVQTCGGWVVVTSDGTEAKDLIECGRRFQRMALLMRERSIAVHPMMQLLEEGARDTVQHGLGIHNPIQWILRVSYIENYPEPVSQRRPVEWFASGK